MSVTIDSPPEIREYKQLVPTFEYADGYLRNLLEKDFTDVKVDWTVARDDRNRPTLSLRLTDYVGSTSRQVPVEELNDWNRVEREMIRTCQDMLDQRHRYHHRRIEKMLEEVPEE